MFCPDITYTVELALKWDVVYVSFIEQGACIQTYLEAMDNEVSTRPFSREWIIYIPIIE